MSRTNDSAARDAFGVLAARHVDRQNLLAGQEFSQRKRERAFLLDSLVPRHQIVTADGEHADGVVPVAGRRVQRPLLRLEESDSQRQLRARTGEREALGARRGVLAGAVRRVRLGHESARVIAPRNPEIAASLKDPVDHSAKSLNRSLTGARPHMLNPPVAPSSHAEVVVMSELNVATQRLAADLSASVY